MLATFRLAGAQDVLIDSTAGGTRLATVNVSIGRSVIYMHSMEAASHWLKIWTAAGRHKPKLPVRRPHLAVTRNNGLAIPSMVLHATGAPPSSISMVNPKPGADILPACHVQIGQVAFRIADREAMASVVDAMGEAAKLALGDLPQLQYRPPESLPANGVVRELGL